MKSAWVVGADMGYGHARAARPLLSIAEGGSIVNANNYVGIPMSDKQTWEGLEKFYYKISRLREEGGLIGRLIFKFYDRFQRIKPIVPGRSEVRPIPQLMQLIRMIRGGWGKHLVETLAEKPLPLVTTFFTVAHMAEQWRYPGPIYVVATDSDISRAWVSPDPKHSTIIYFAPTDTVALHLELYGVPRDRIVPTGFPIPSKLTVNARKNFEERLVRLAGLPAAAGSPALGGAARKPVTLTFAVGGAGAQTRIGEELSRDLSKLIHADRVHLHLVAGTNAFARDGFLSVVEQAHLSHYLGDRISVLFTETKGAYFDAFDALIAETDVLWTKPSELSFYAALGIPIIIAPPVGSQEERNRAWLLGLEAGIDEGNPKRVREWLPELIEGGMLAALAQNGYERMERNGTENIITYLRRHHL